MAEDDSMESDGPLDEENKKGDEPASVPPKKAGRSRKAAAASAPTGAKPKTKASLKSEQQTPKITNSTTAASDGEGSPSKKKRGPKPKKERNPDDPDVKRKKYVSTHPRTLDMITEALEEMQDGQGSSVQAIRTWIIMNYKVRTDMMKTMLKRALTQGLASGVVCRPKGQGESSALLGRYKLGRPGSDSDPSHPAPPRTNPRPARNQALVRGLGSSTGLKKKGKKKKGAFGKKAKRPGVKPKRK